MATTETTNIKTTTISLVRGNPVPMNIHVTLSGVAVNLTGGTIYFTVKRHWKDTLNVFQKSKSEHDNAVNGITSLKLLPADTILLDVGGEYYYDITFVDSAGEPLTFLRGKLDVVYNVKDLDE